MKNIVILFLCCFTLLPGVVSVTGCNKDEDNTASAVEDIDGNIYNTTIIGDQVWMTSNLKTTRYNDGSEIPLETSNEFWDIGNTPGYCWYKNDEDTYGAKYGALYNFYAVDSKKLCPVGWHVPTQADWVTLEDFLGGPEIAGGKLKEPGMENWKTANHVGLDNYGFTALPAGWREPMDGKFEFIGEGTIWWTSNPKDQQYAFSRFIAHDTIALFPGNIHFTTGSSVRCIQD